MTEDAFTRWDAGQRLSSNVLLALVRDHAEGRAAGPLDSRLVAAFAANLDRVDEDPALAARALSLPGSGYLGQQMAVIDVEGIRHAIDHVRDQLGTALRDRWLAAYRAHVDEGPFSLETAAMARRSLKNLALAYPAHAGDAEARELVRRPVRDRRQHDRQPERPAPDRRDRDGRTGMRRWPPSTSAGGTSRWW